jgi:hypothetical protein
MRTILARSDRSGVWPITSSEQGRNSSEPKLAG